MTHRKLFLIVALLLGLVLLLSPTVTYADGPGPGGKLIFGGTFTLQSGETLGGDLVVFGGAVSIAQNAEVDGDVAIIGGTATINGYVDGDVVALGGTITLGPTAEIDGDATAVGGLINRDPAAQVHGNIVETQSNLEEELGGRIGPGGMEITPVAPGGIEGNFMNFPLNRVSHGPIDWLMRILFGGMSAIAWTALLAGLGVILVLIAPRHTERVANAIHHNIFLAFGIGALALILLTPVIGILTVILALTICLLPVAIAIPFLLLLILLFGWLALGWLIGKELLRKANTSNATPIWEALVGVAILTLLWRLPGVVPFIGWFFSLMVLFVAGSIAIGGVLLTRFGFRDYPAAPQPAAPPPPPESALPPESTVPAEPEEAEAPQHPIVPPPPPPPPPAE